MLTIIDSLSLLPATKSGYDVFTQVVADSMAEQANPSRWGKLKVRNCEPAGPTTPNPTKVLNKQNEIEAA
jgi:hypothetical protein|tara:strand:- start:205 stop:414 length:210 start_codon:yes stop_codon:yes gene_type:complete